MKYTEQYIAKFLQEEKELRTHILGIAREYARMWGYGCAADDLTVLDWDEYTPELQTTEVYYGVHKGEPCFMVKDNSDWAYEYLVPVRYVCNDNWRELAEADITEYKQKASKARKEHEAQRAAEQVKVDRALYEDLKRKYGWGM